MKSSMQRKRRNPLKGLYWHLDRSSACLIFFSVIFAPWAFATVHPWSILTLNFVSFGLGILLTAKLLIRHRTRSSASCSERVVLGRAEAALITILPVLILLFIGMHYLNARATFDNELLIFNFNPRYISWLPASYDKGLTASLFAKYLALAVFFWSTYDWITDRQESLSCKSSDRRQPSVNVPRMSPRAEKVLFLICINASLIALVSMLQKLDNSGKLLWILEPSFTKDKNAIFGPFAYRGNAATYFNLIWPISLFLLLHKRAEFKFTHHAARAGGGIHILLYPLTLILILAPVLTTSRAGLIILVLTLCVTTPRLIWTSNHRNIIALTSLVILGISLSFLIFGSNSMTRLKSTITTGFQAQKDSRMDIYRHLPDLARDHLIFGSGPGTFSTIYLVHRKPAINVLGWKAAKEHRNDRLVGWSAWAHCDPLEFLITFGILGTALCLAWLLALQFIPWLIARRTTVPPPPINFFLVQTGTWGFLLHSTVDFPFQVYSLFHIYLIVSACILGTIARGSESRRILDPMPWPPSVTQKKEQGTR